ncbi:GLPGLI family protein [Candidatus Dojkabacteria bacterium]|jgi:GLPGLI family protein|uniref:GLPGLI family protein n=1 Tax=Candidatus Dojkabacteria bacterium TaxID=2099670 RepID=A0A847ETR8_9BACT|nr:GLPGLI family protein [Candidatus Dojkabacteria bacterium]
MKPLAAFLTIITFSFPGLVKGQSNIKPIDEVVLELHYKLTFQRDSTDKESIRTEIFVLQIGKQVSRFISMGNLYMDSALVSNPNMDFSDLFRNRPRFSHHWEIFKAYPEGKITTIDYVLPDSYKYQEDLDLFNWVLMNDNSEILGNEVQKSIADFGGRTWEAWFAPEIPFNDGPYKFNGLPGLILNICDTKKYYCFELQSIRYLEAGSKSIYFRDSRYIETTKSVFFQSRERFRQDFVGGLLSTGMPIHENTNLDRAQNNMRRRNNPIELTAD